MIKDFAIAVALPP
jgi:hypothetical protein